MSSDTPRVGRRRFLSTGLGIAAAAGVGAGGLVAWAVTARLRWGAHVPIPDGPARLELSGEGLPEGAPVRVQVVVMTPQDTFFEQAAPARVEGGRVIADVVLSYPYERRMHGDYRYHAEVRWPGGSARTQASIGYSLRHLRPLC